MPTDDRTDDCAFGAMMSLALGGGSENYVFMIADSVGDRHPARRRSGDSVDRYYPSSSGGGSGGAGLLGQGFKGGRGTSGGALDTAAGATEKIAFEHKFEPTRQICRGIVAAGLLVELARCKKDAPVATRGSFPRHSSRLRAKPPCSAHLKGRRFWREQ
jgi:hypothetical protein